MCHKVCLFQTLIPKWRILSVDLLKFVRVLHWTHHLKLSALLLKDKSISSWKEIEPSPQISPPSGEKKHSPQPITLPVVYPILELPTPPEYNFCIRSQDVSKVMTLSWVVYYCCVVPRRLTCKISVNICAQLSWEANILHLCFGACHVGLQWKLR